MREPHATDGHVVPDRQRAERLGFDEAILCDSKSTDQLQAIVGIADSRGQTLLLTRLAQESAADLASAFPDRLDYDPLSRTAYFGTIQKPSALPRVAVVSAGTSDVPVCREAVRALWYYGVRCVEIYDVGVAGLWRLLDRIEEIAGFPVVIVVAGMDASLPSVVAGLVPSFIVAVPTSTGYGVAAQGQTALKAILSSCAPGLVAVNVDNGFGAAGAALRVLRASEGFEQRRG